MSAPEYTDLDLFVESPLAIGECMRGRVDGIEVKTAPLFAVDSHEVANPGAAVTWTHLYLVDTEVRRWRVRARGYAVGRLTAQRKARRRQEVLL